MAASDTERAALLAQHAALLDVGLAHALKEQFDAYESSDPQRAIHAAHALASLAEHSHAAEVAALAAWTGGMAAQLTGELETSIRLLYDAEARFLVLAHPLHAAATQVSNLIGLALLGRYDEAISAGLRARAVFVAHGDELAAGKIEQNLGNIYFRRDQYQTAEQLYRMACQRFTRIGDQKQLAQIYNCLGSAVTWQHQFRAAAHFYEQALAHATASDLAITQAEIESNLGSLALFQGRYKQALDYLERSRRRYAALDMAHESAIAECELADAYLHLNLASEAVAIYARVIPTLAALGMRAEQAWALTRYSSGCLALGQIDEAQRWLSEARMLHVAEGNLVGAAMVTLTEAQLHFTSGDLSAAAQFAAQAEDPLTQAGVWEWLLLARWLRSEALRALRHLSEARQLLVTVLHDAQRLALPQIILRCHTSLGLLATATGQLNQAETAFQQAVELVEDLRAPLPAEEFRTAFVADKLTPYAELVRLCLVDGRPQRVALALSYLERARSRALLDMLGGNIPALPKPRDAFEAELSNRLAELRMELNWFYSQINRPLNSEEPRTPAVLEHLQTAIREREAAILEITRQIQQCSENGFITIRSLDVCQLQHDLGHDTALVEYFSLDGELLAFVVTHEQIEVIRHLSNADQVDAAVSQLRFQTDTLRHGVARMRNYIPQLTHRALHYLTALYDQLLRPFEDRLGKRRLVVVPYRTLHYVPFHALYDGATYLIERREVCYAPAAGVLHHCLMQPVRPLTRALLLGVSDEQTPHVDHEIMSIAPLFPEAITLLDQQATLTALRAQAAAVDVLHLACHGQFRPDNPLFSALRLADGWFTVHDAYNLALQSELVTLSACETGVSAVAPGDELIGLARGFFSAGVPTLLVSLWTVDDETTAQLMTSFYTRLRAGERPAAALRYAQCELLKQHPHPFFWSPFILLGRW